MYILHAYVHIYVDKQVKLLYAFISTLHVYAPLHPYRVANTHRMPYLFGHFA